MFPSVVAVTSTMPVTAHFAASSPTAGFAGCSPPVTIAFAPHGTHLTLIDAKQRALAISTQLPLSARFTPLEPRYLGRCARRLGRASGGIPRPEILIEARHDEP